MPPVLGESSRASRSLQSFELTGLPDSPPGLPLCYVCHPEPEPLAPLEMARKAGSLTREKPDAGYSDL